MSENYQLLPPLSSTEYEALKADIAARGGLHSPIVLDADTDAVLDGHHRAEACSELGIEPTIERRSFDSEAHKRAFALAANLSRRQLSPEQRSAVKQAQKDVYLDLRKEGCTQADAAGLVGISRTMGTWWEDQSNVNFDNALADQRLSVPRDEREAIYLRREAGEALVRIAADYKVTPERIGQIVRQVEAKLNTPQPVTSTPTWPDGAFRCITIDPPWPVAKIEREQRPDQSTTLDYWTLPVDCGEDKHEEDPLCCIRAVPVPALADQRGAHIYLWVTHKYLPSGLSLFGAWGVRYQCVMTWRKNVGPTPFTWMYDTEHVLFGRVGDLPLERNGLRLSFEAPAIGHSIKPGAFYERVSDASPENRLALFERGERAGFTVWGNEVTA